MSIGTDSYKIFCLTFWRIFFTIIKNSKVIGILLTWLIAVLLFICAHSIDNNTKLMNITMAAWQAVAASILAATIYSLITWIIDVMKESKEKTYDDYYSKIAIENGIHEIFSQKGSDLALKTYKDCLQKATTRVWAFGMTNGNLADQHIENFEKLLTNHKIDIVIAFWSPFSKLLTPRHNKKERSIISVQQMIEESAVVIDNNWEQVIKGRQDTIIERINKAGMLKGRLRIINVSRVTNFSCFIIDDGVFFFPFLHGPHSNNEPIIYCDAQSGIGQRISDHHERLMNGKISIELCETVFDSQMKK
jgi:hypothetical protein